MTAPSGEQIALSFGEQHAVVVEVGGGLRTYSVGGRDVLDGYPAQEMAHGGRGQLLAPWPNRIEDGCYTFDGAGQQLPLSEAARRNAIHGLVRWEAWTPTHREAHRVVMEHVLHPQPGYPFRLDLRVEYRLGADGLTVATTAENTCSQPSPYGNGWHPYLALGEGIIDDLVLRSPARTVLACDDRGIPVGRQAVDGSPYDFREGRPIGDIALDHAFTTLAHGSDGRAVVALSDPGTGRTVELWMDASYDHLMVYSGDTLPVGDRRRGLAIEPMTCPPNAFRTGEDVIRLEPGDSVTTTWGLRELEQP